MGTKSADSFRAEETKTGQNEVKGVYSWLDPNGSPHLVAFNSGQQGYRTLPLQKAGLALPPFPYGLYQPRPLQIQSRSKDDDDIVVIGMHMAPKVTGFLWRQK